MKATILIDNIADENLASEWGLSVFIEYNRKRILLDTGSGKKFLQNAKELGIDLTKVDYAVLSHAHYDHAYGMKYFFNMNDHTKFYLQENCKENCYSKKSFFRAYIGIRKGTLKKYKDRIVYVKGDAAITDGLTLIPHKTEGLDKVGIASSMYRKENGKWVPDDYNHEQSLIFDTEKGLVIFNSCSHAGADIVIREAMKTYSDKKIYALIGGFHLFRMSDEKVRALAARIRETGIEKIYTGHCTGQRAFHILHDELGDMATMIKSGMIIEL